MIFVDRSSVANPLDLNTELGQLAIEEKRKAEKYHNDGVLNQSRFPFQVYKAQKVANALERLFHSKCAYCESELSSITRGNIEHYRPRYSVTDASDHPGYWWLASNWDNLLLACQLCGFSRYAKRDESSSASINGKGNRFPLENESARAYLPGEEIAEEPLLIDPTRDDPELHLIYGDDGAVFGRTER